MPKIALMLGLMIMVGLPAASTGASAAELQIPPADQARHYREAEACGPCGCLRVSWDYHRVMEQTYGSGFDPRNFDTTEPYFYLGRVKAYPRYWCDGDPLQY
jgi:hypothetical protein